MAFLIGIDVGTSGVKSVLMDHNGRIRASALEEYPLLLPQPGWSEQHPEQWWESTKTSLRRLLAESKANPKQIKGLSFSGQMHGLVCLDAEGQVVRPAILWNDLRTTEQCRAITKKIGAKRLIRLVSNPALEGFTLPKVLWVKQKEPRNWKKVRTIMLPKDYICYRLTGKAGMEVSDGAGTLMMDVGKGRWCSPLLKAFGIDEGLLPELHRSIAVAGEVSQSVGRETGLPVGLPIVYGGADNACAAVGNGVVQPGLVAASIGTSGTVVAPMKSAARDPGGRLHTFNHAVPRMWYLMGVMQAAGLSLRWLRDEFAAAETATARRMGDDPYNLLARQAASIGAGSEGLIWLPYLTGERTPHQDPHAKGVLFGVTARHTRAHVIRAVMEGVAFGMRDSFELMRKLKTPIKQIRLTGGGAQSPLWRQIQADVYGHEVVTINVDAGPSFGAAIIAGVGVGVYKDFPAACGQLIKVDKRIQPIEKNVQAYERSYKLFRELYPALKDSMAKATALG